MKVSRIAVKVATRLLLILLIMGLLPALQGDQSKLRHIYLTFHHKWEMIFPAVLIFGFIGLLIYCIIKKYREPDMNWLLVLNTIILIVYGMAIYIRVYHMV